MSSTLQISLEDIAKQLKESENKYSTIQDVLDEIYSTVMNGVNVASLLTSGITVPDLLKNFKPSNLLNQFMPKQYLHISKEEASIRKYEKLTISNLSIILISFNQAIQENKKEINEIFNEIELPRTSLEKENKVSHIESNIAKNYNKLLKTKCTLPNINDTKNIDDYTMVLFSVWNELFQNSGSALKFSIEDKIIASTRKYYYINLFEIVSEFPEVKLWVDLEYQREILSAHSKVKEVLDEIYEFQKKDFQGQFGLSEIESLLLKNSDQTLKSLKEILKDTNVLENIEAHHKYIESIVNEELLEENDIVDMVLPKRKEIYIPQSYKFFYYQEQIHKKNYLDSSNWSTISHQEKEDIGTELFHALKNPHNIDQPIIILGNPGAGKSMFSSLFAYRLIENNEFVPFLIKLRIVDSSITDIDTHINQGIGKSIGVSDVNWIEWAKKFPDKIPVIILDGFDELLRASTTQLNNYIIEIQRLQRTAQFHNLNIRVILTSRLTIMQDVKIPDNCLIIKLNSFDMHRKNLWIKKWNENQKDKHFSLPNRDDIHELSKEPLLLFLLAIYDFEDNALSKIADEGLNKSLLYDKLFKSFTKRQLNKDVEYKNANEQVQEKLDDLFRLRIGFFAQMLFLHDRVYHYENDFNEELKEFQLSDKNNTAKNVLDGFFFVHKDKSMDGHENESLSFEFLHKTFGEFLSVDFMLRVAKFYAKDNMTDLLSGISVFRQTFSYQWICKQPKILDFLFEYTKEIFDNENLIEKLINDIRKELNMLLDESNNIMLPQTLHKLKVFEKLKHVAIYSQNLILIWIALENEEFSFSLSNKLDSIKCWEVLLDLWKNYGGYDYVSYLRNYIETKIVNDTVIIKKIKNNNYDTYSDYSNYTQLLNSNDKLISSFYESNFLLKDIITLRDNGDQEISQKLSELIVTKLNYINILDSEYLNEEIFWSLFQQVSTLSKMQLIYFFTDANIYFNVKKALDELSNVLIKFEGLSPLSKLKFIELQFEKNAISKNGLNMLIDLYEFLNVHDYSIKILTSSEQLRLIEMIKKVNGKEEIVINLLTSFTRKVKISNYLIKVLTTTENFRLIHLLLEFDFDHVTIQNFLEKFSDLLMVKAQNNIYSDYTRLHTLTLKQKMNLIELLLQFGDNRTKVVYILNDIYKTFTNKRLIHKNLRELSPSEKLSLIELFLMFKGESSFISDLILELPEYIKNGSGFLSNWYKNLEEKI